MARLLRMWNLERPWHHIAIILWELYVELLAKVPQETQEEVNKKFMHFPFGPFFEIHAVMAQSLVAQVSS